jgi:hypothetical protein
MTGEEYTFFESNDIIKAYEQDKNYQSTLCEPMEGEPGLLFHEFIFVLGRIAANCVNTSDNIAGKLNDFFVEKLNFHRVHDIQKTAVTYDDITRKMYMSDDEAIFSDEEDEGWESEEGELDENQKKLMEFL